MPKDNVTWGFSTADKDAILAQLGNRPEHFPETKPRGGAGGAKFFLTPGGGIAAATGSSSPWTPGSATCTIVEWSGSTIASTSTTATVYNPFDQSIAASVVITAQKIGGKWVVDAASCG